MFTTQDSLAQLSYLSSVQTPAPPPANTLLLQLSVSHGQHRLMLITHLIRQGFPQNGQLQSDWLTLREKRRMSATSIALEVAEVEGQLVSAQTMRHTLQQVGLHGRRPRRKPLLKLAHKKPANSLLKTTWPRAWITGTMSCGLMSLR